MSNKIFLVDLSLICVLLVGCEKQYQANDGYVSKIVELEVSESKESEFFELDRNDYLAHEDIPKIKKFFKDAKARGVNEVSFLITLNKSIKDMAQEKICRRVMTAAYKAGFINSRITNSGILIYEGAKRGVRIDALKYDIKEPDCSPWSEYIGDIDTNKNLPRFGVSDKYNLREMIANDADLVSPRRYKGQAAHDAIRAAGTTK
ncbi:hypothetical protein FACS1894122_10170 [Alphaproteobacteria bacterium]|nr:hypothetical protein FACS1894122_10170 [Alphaproteobacteria bacterium]